MFANLRNLSKFSSKNTCGFVRALYGSSSTSVAFAFAFAFGALFVLLEEELPDDADAFETEDGSESLDLADSFCVVVSWTVSTDSVLDSADLVESGSAVVSA